MKAKHARTLELIFSRPTPAGVQWGDVVALMTALGAEFEEREGSRVAVIWNGQVQVMHRPHPRPEVDKGAIAALRKWLEEHGAKP